MKRLNNYGITSGGYIFDLLDREAQKEISIANPEYQYWLTASAKIRYLKQSTTKTQTLVIIRGKASRWRPNVIHVSAVLVDVDEDDVIAFARFKFIGKNHLHKGGKNDKN